jgi:hypothetical protein
MMKALVKRDSTTRKTGAFEIWWYMRRYRRKIGNTIKRTSSHLLTYTKTEKRNMCF